MPSTFIQVVLLLVFIVPGFILMRVKRIAYPGQEGSAPAMMLDCLTLSSFVHALCSPIWYWAYISQPYILHPVWFGVSLFGILFAVPIALGSLYVKFSETERARWLRELLGLPHPAPTAWDYHFRKGRAYWVWMTFKSGAVMAGLFGPNSAASSFPNKQDLYVEKLLSLDEHGKVRSWVDASAGAVVRMDDLERIEFFEIEVMPS